MPRVRRSCHVRSTASGIAPQMPDRHHCSDASHHHSDDDHEHQYHHGHSHFPESPVSRLLDRLGLISISTELTHSGRWTITSIACFAVVLMAGASVPTVRLIGGSVAAAAATALQNAALAGTFALSALPQAVEAACVAGSGRLDTHVLISLAVVGTLVIGMAQEGALLTLLFQISHSLEERFTARARASAERLFTNIPTQAMLVDLDPGYGHPLMEAATQVLARSVRPGQYVLVKPGEQVPLDGMVAWGAAGVSMAHISGESHPLRVSLGSTVPAGSLNIDGLLAVQVTATSDDSTPARIARMTAVAQAAKPRLQLTLDRVGRAWSKAVIAVTLATLVGLPLLAGVPLFGPGGALYRAMGVLTAGSPCAVVLVPLAYVCAIATATRRGVLIKSAGSLELLGQCGTVALDKTGTLTTGSLTLTDTVPIHCNAPFCSSSSGGNDTPSFSDHDAETPHTQSSSPSPFIGSPSVSSSPSLGNPKSKYGSRSFSLSADSSSSRSSLGGSGTFSLGSGAGSDVPLSGSGAFSCIEPGCSAQDKKLPGSGGGGGNEASLCTAAMRYCVALSRGSNHPVSRAVVQAAADADGTKELAEGVTDVQVSMFEEVPGVGIQGICRHLHSGDSAGEESLGPPMLVRFGSLGFVKGCLPLRSLAADRLEHTAEMQRGCLASKAMSFLMITPYCDPVQQPPASGQLLASLAPTGSDTVPPSPLTSLPRASEPSADGSETDDCFLSMLCFEDEVQPGVKRAIKALRTGSWRQGGGEAGAKEVIMLTGDNEQVAQQVASQVGISSFHAALKPEDKLAFIASFDSKAAAASKSSSGGGDRGWQQSRDGLLMMGDGINDAPALAVARVGVAVAMTPSDMVAAAADIIVLSGRGISSLSWLFALAHKTQLVIKQSLALALASVVFATLPTIAGFFPLWLAVLLHEGATVLVALNSLRLLVDEEDAFGAHQSRGRGSGGSPSDEDREGEEQQWGNRRGLLQTASTLMETLRDVFGSAGPHAAVHCCNSKHDGRHHNHH